MVTPTSTDTRAGLIRVVTFIGGLYFFLYFVLPESAVTALGIKAHHEEISNGFIVVGVMALGLGLFNLIRAHGARCVFVKPGWINSLALICGLVAMVMATSAQWIESETQSAELRSAQIIGEFATRIIEDSEAPPVDRQVPALNQRISALIRYGEERAAAIEIYANGALSQRSPSPNPATAANAENLAPLVAEVLERSARVRGAIDAMRAAKWEALDAGNKELLQRLSQDATRLASSYSILKRVGDANTPTRRIYEFLFDGLFNQLGSAMFALLGVYIAAAAYRAFRVKTFESALMMASAIVVMLGQISFGREIYEGIPALRQWLLEVPNSAAFRAIRLGAGVAGLMLAIRMWLSIESGKFSSRR